MNCINRNTIEYKQLLDETKLHPFVLDVKIAKWQDNNSVEDFPTSDQILGTTEVNQTLKAVDILSSNKAISMFEKGEKNNWSLDKILTELQIPKEQKQLILDSELTNREQIALELAANYSFTVEVNVTKENLPIYKFDENENFNKVVNEEDPNSQYYSNLTVPGGTQYTENEISTPLITPSIKGHAQFATDNGIGWFRSDDKIHQVNKWNEFTIGDTHYMQGDKSSYTEPTFLNLKEEIKELKLVKKNLTKLKRIY